MGYVAPSYTTNAMAFIPYLNDIKDHFSVQSDWNTRKYCWNIIYISLTEINSDAIFNIYSDLERVGGWGLNSNRQGEGLLQ